MTKSGGNTTFFGKLVISIILAFLFIGGGYYLYEITHRSEVHKFFRDGKPFGILILNVRDRQAQDLETTFISIAHIHPSTSRIGFISFYPSTHLNVEEGSLAEKIRRMSGGDIESIKEELSAILKLPVNYHIITDFAGISKFIDLAEGIDYFHWDPNHLKRDLPVGEFILDGSMVEKILLPANTNEGAQALQLFSHYTLFLNFWKDRQAKWELLKAPGIFTLASQGIDTDLALNDMLFLGNTIFDNENWLPMFMEIPVKRDIDKFFIDLDASALFLKNLNKDLTDEKNPYVSRTPRVEVRNGTRTANLARKTGRVLSRKGITILEFSNADRNTYKESILLDVSANPYYLISMARALGIKKYYASVNKSLFTDVILILGEDHEKYTVGDYE